MDHIKCVSWLSFSEKHRQKIIKNDIDQVQETKYTELKKYIFMKRSKASTCRELLNQIRNLLFVVYDNDALDHLYDELVKLIENFKYHAPKGESLILEKPKFVGNVNKFSKIITLPKPKLKKVKFNG